MKRSWFFRLMSWKNNTRKQQRDPTERKKRIYFFMGGGGGVHRSPQNVSTGRKRGRRPVNEQNISEEDVVAFWAAWMKPTTLCCVAKEQVQHVDNMKHRRSSSLQMLSSQLSQIGEAGLWIEPAASTRWQYINWISSLGQVTLQRVKVKEQIRYLRLIQGWKSYYWSLYTAG